VDQVLAEWSFPKTIIGAWQLSTGHHREDAPRATDYTDLERIVEMQAAVGPVAFDCADIYTGVEELLGTLASRLAPRVAAGALSPLRFHTKLVPDRSQLAQLDRSYVTRIVDRSRARLGVDCLDLVQFAWWDYEVPGYVELGLILSELQNEGKIAQIGVTNFDAARLSEILDAGVAVASNQLQYSALDHRPEAATVELCSEHRVALLCYGTLAGGFLSDRWLNRADPAPDPRSHATALGTRSLTKYRLIIEEFGGWDAYQALLQTLSEVGAKHGVTLAQVATAYALSRSGVAAVIAGATHPKRWAETLEATRIRLSVADVNRIKAHALEAPGPAGPVFGLEREPGGLHAAIMKYDLNAGSEELG